MAAIARRRVTEAATLLMVALLLTGLLTAQKAAAASSDEVTMRTYINQERLDHGLSQLHMGAKLSKFAGKHSRDMAESNRLYHSSNLSLLLAPASVTVAGENVGVGGTLEEVHEAFMESPPHKHNLLNKKYESVGVGIVTADGRIWVTVVFSG